MQKRIVKLTLLILWLSFQQCKFMSCDERTDMYRKEAFRIKLEKVYDDYGPHYTLEGKNELNQNTKWKDFSTWIIDDIKKHIAIGDSVIKPMGKTYILIKKPNDTIEYKYFVECGGHEYQD